MYEAQIIIQNSFGEFIGKKSLLTEDQLIEITNIAKGFWIQGGFELNLEDGSFVVFPPNIVQNSLLKIVKTRFEDIEEDV